MCDRLDAGLAELMPMAGPELPSWVLDCQELEIEPAGVVDDVADPRRLMIIRQCLALAVVLVGMILAVVMVM